ncbi:hypothetical protein [Leuconostoc lactis]
MYRETIVISRCCACNPVISSGACSKRFVHTDQVAAHLGLRYQVDPVTDFPWYLHHANRFVQFVIVPEFGSPSDWHHSAEIESHLIIFVYPQLSGCLPQFFD